jgi:hypothetical protein
LASEHQAIFTAAKSSILQYAYWYYPPEYKI